MAGTSTAGLSRVTIVAPRTRVDLALPSGVPFTDLLPTLLRQIGPELADDPAGRDGWSVSRLGSPPFELSRTPTQLEIRDGELLYLRPRGAEPPEPVFDDVVDAVATATRDRAGRWRHGTTRRFGLAVGVVALLGGAAMVLLAGQPRALAGAVGFILAALVLTIAALVSRVGGDSATGVLLAVPAMAYAAAGGLVVLAGGRGLTDTAAPDVLVAAMAVLVVAAAGVVAVADGAEVFLAAGIVALAAALAAIGNLAFGTAPAGATAIVLAVLLATVPALPMLSYRIAGLPVPSVPTGPEDLRTDAESVDGRAVLALSERADRYLAGMLTALAVFTAGSAVALASAGRLPGVLLCAVTGLLLISRARWFIGRMQRLPLLVAGLFALATAVLAGYVAASPVLRLAVMLPIALVVAGISVAYALAGAGRRHSPMWGRALDILEILLILSVLPLVAWVSGLYGWARALRS